MQNRQQLADREPLRSLVRINVPVLRLRRDGAGVCHTIERMSFSRREIEGGTFAHFTPQILSAIQALMESGIPVDILVEYQRDGGKVVIENLNMIPDELS